MKKYIFAGLIVLLSSVTSVAFSQEISDAGVWSSDNDDFQGLNFVPVGETLFADESLIVFWYAYDESGNQVWFISDNVETNPSRNYQRVDLFNPICGFRILSEECEVGDPIGVIDISELSNDRFDIRFAIDESVGDFSEGCDPNGIGPRVSPLPPALPDQFECKGEMVLKRVTPSAFE